MARSGETSADLTRRLAAMPGAERHRVLLNLVRSNAAAVLGHRHPDEVRADVPFKDLGFDSLTAVELRNRLSAATGLRLPPALVFDYPQPAVLAGQLLSRLQLDGAADGPSDGAPDPIGSVLADLGRVESALGALTLDQGGREQVGRRLRGLLARFDVDRAAPTAADVETASDEEMFELIDKQLRSS